MNAVRNMLGKRVYGLVLLVTIVFVVITACSLPPPGNVGSPTPASTSFQTAWVEIGPAGVAIARMVTDAAECPRLYLNTRPFSMQVRAQPVLPDFPVLVCETILPSGITSAVIDGIPLPLPKTAPQRLVVLGDTGCRLLGAEASQACNDPTAWPFERIARSAARWRPDLVIHVGDYFYRESPCPEGNAGCAGSPWGDNWRAWKADFFSPAAELLRSAPWVMTRGNHELCNRAGRGWFRFLDPQFPSLGCQDYSPAYAIPIRDGQLLILDSAGAQDSSAPTALVDLYAHQFAALREVPGSNAWLVTHRPIWGMEQSGSGQNSPSLFQLNATLQAASTNSLAPSITLVLAGHLHLFEALSFTDGRPPHMIVGNGGTSLDPPITAPLIGQQIAGATVTEATALDRFGFMTLEYSDHGWLGTMYDIDGQAIARCMITGGGLTCDTTSG